MKSLNWKKLLFSVMFSSVFALGGTYLFAQDSDNIESQKAAELEKTEQDLDEKIAEMNSLLSDFAMLKDSEVHMSPTQTRFRQGDDFIEMEKYDFIKDHFGSHLVVGRKTKRVRLYFSGSELVRVESEIEEINFKTGERIISRVVDSSPGSLENSDIEVFTQKNQETPNEVNVGDMENTLSNPNRIKFKREFYLEHLKIFERYFRYTKKYLEQYGSNTDYNSIETLKDSLDY